MTTHRERLAGADSASGIVLPSEGLETAARQWSECAAGLRELVDRLAPGPPGTQRVRDAGHRFVRELDAEFHADAREALRAAGALREVAGELAETEGMVRDLFDRLRTERAQ